MDVEDTACGFDHFNRAEAAEREKARLKRLAERAKLEKQEKKEARRAAVQLWQVYGLARFYRVKYHGYWSADYFLPDEFSETPRRALLETAKWAGQMYSSPVPVFDAYRSTRIAHMYGPRRQKMIAEYFETLGRSVFSFIPPDGTERFSIPLRIVRSVRKQGTFQIAALSELHDWVGIWLQSESPLNGVRHRHALLEWDAGKEDEMLLSFVNFEQGRLNWREVEVSGVFDGFRLPRIDSYLIHHE